MAPNKKPKENFAEALKSVKLTDAEKKDPYFNTDLPMPKKGDSNESIVVDLGGVETVIHRPAGQSDKEWNSVIESVSDKLVSRTTAKVKSHPGAKPADTKATWKTAMNEGLVKTEGTDRLVTPEELDALKRINPDTAAKFLEARALSHSRRDAKDNADYVKEQKNNPVAGPQEEKPSTQKPYDKATSPKPLAESDLRPFPGSDSGPSTDGKSDGPGTEQLRRLTRPAQQLTPDEQQDPYFNADLPMPEKGSNGPGMSVMGNVAEMAKGGISGDLSSDGTSRPFDASVDINGSPSNALNPLNPLKAVGAGIDAAPRVIENLPAGASIVAGGIAQNAGNTAAALGDLTGSETLQSTGEGWQQSGQNSWNEGMASGNTSAPVMAGGVDGNGTMPSPAAPLANPPPPRGQGSTSVSGSLMGPSGFKVENADPALMQAAKDAADSYARKISDAQDTVAAQNHVQQGLVENAVQQQLKIAGEAAGLSKLASEAKMRSVAEAQRVNSAYDQISAEAQRAAASPIDPNRYWNNKDIGQKAAAVLAGAMFGFTGQGMQWLQRIDGLVAEDNRLQASDRASKVQGLEKRAAALGELGQRALQLGATESEAFLMEKASKYEMLKSYLDTAQMQMQGSQAAVTAATMSAQLDAPIMQAREQLATMGQHAADSKTEANYKNAMLKRQAFEFGAKHGGDGKPVNQVQAMQLGKFAAAEREMEKLKSMFGEKNIISRFMDKGMAMFPGTSANRYNSAKDQVIQMIGPMMGSGTLQQHDLERWGDLMSKAGDLDGEYKLNMLLGEVRNAYQSQKEGLRATGADVRGFPDFSQPSEAQAPSYAKPQ